MTVQSEHGRYMEEKEADTTRLQALVDRLSHEKKDIAALLEEEKR